jgi:Flp pilus assembly protein TadG
MDDGSFWRKIIDDRRGAIGVLGAFVLVSLLGMSALALEYGHSLLQKTENQRIADLAAVGGALVYNSTGSTDSATSAIDNIVTLNGLPSTDASIAYPTANGNQQVQVTVTTQTPLLLARVLTTNTTLPVSAAAVAQVNSAAPGCIIALGSTGSGIVANGGTSITANNCAIASNNVVAVSGGAHITTATVDYGTSYSVSGGAAITAPRGGSPTYSKITTSDPLAGNSAVATATSRISTVSSIASPSAPVVTVPSGSAVSFTKTSVTGLPSGCSDTYNSSAQVYTVTCSGSGPFNFGAITLSGVSVVLQTASGATYNFQNSLPSGVTLSGSGGTYGFGAGLSTSGTMSLPAGTYNVVGTLSLAGTTTLGAGTYNVTAGIAAGGGSNTTFGAGTYNLGTMASCSGTGGYSICNTGTSLTFAGPSTFVLAGGIYNGGGAALVLGNGATNNSYNIGKASDGYSINAGTSKSMILDDATGSADIFQTSASITSGGGSCLAIPAATQHDVNGNMTFSGGVVLGAGIYTINGYFALGASSGGDVSNCPASGTTTGLSALAVTLVISGIQTVGCNGVSSSTFCLGAGYSTVVLTAPSSGSTEQLAVLTPSTNSGAAAFTTGATNTQISGAFYIPNGPVTMSGAAALHDTVDTGACLELVGLQVTLGGGSAAGSTCAGLGGGSSGTTVSLVQ